MSIHVRTGYYAEVYFDHSKKHLSGIVVDVTRRYGYHNKDNPIPINDLVTLKLDDGTTKHFDTSFVTRCVHPSKVGLPYKVYVKERTQVFNFLSRTKNPNRTRKRRVLCGTPQTLWYEALPGVVRDYGDKVFCGKRIFDLFLNHSAVTKVECGNFYVFKVSRKNLRKLIKQNVNRMLKPAKEIHEHCTAINFEEEAEYWKEQREYLDVELETLESEI